MTHVVAIDDRNVIAAWLRRDEAMHVYALADLDDFFWPKTRWWAIHDRAGAPQANEIHALAFVLGGFKPPVLYAVARPNDPATARLLAELAPQLPQQCFVNLMHGALASLAGYSLGSAGTFMKMTISHADAQRCFAATEVRVLTPSDLAALNALHASEPNNTNDIRFFQPYMLERWPYAGIFAGTELVAAGGCHVLSEQFGVAAIGNVLTHPQWRGRSLATRITQALCAWLAPRVATIGLNVKADNASAIHCYARIGFREIVRYEEGVLTRRAR